MAPLVVTYDFHNTIASAETWFRIEVHDLPGAYLRWRYEQVGDQADPAIIDEANALYRELRLAIHHHGHEVAAEPSIELILHQIGFDESPAMIDEGTEAIMRASLLDLAPMPGVIESIRDFQEAGVQLGIVSSAVYHPFLLWSLEQFGILDAFSSVTTSASAGFYKSRPEIYWSALESLDASPEQALHLGDSYRFDVIGAQRAGMRTAWYQRPGAKPIDGDGTPHLTIDHLAGAASKVMEQLETTS